MKTIATLGQSLQAGWSEVSANPPAPDPRTSEWHPAAKAFGAVAGDANIVFANALAELLQEEVRLVCAARGGSALCPQSVNPDDTLNYWLTAQAGSPFDWFLQQLFRIGPPDLVLWNQGQQDYWNSSYATYLEGLRQLYSLLLADTGRTPGTLPMVVFVSGAYSNASLSTYASQVRQAQIDACAIPGIRPGPNYLGMTTVDGTHLDTPHYVAMARRTVGFALNALLPLSTWGSTN